MKQNNPLTSFKCHSLKTKIEKQHSSWFLQGKSDSRRKSAPHMFVLMHRRRLGNYKPQNTYLPALVDGSGQVQILSTYLPVHIKGPQISQCWGITSYSPAMTNPGIKNRKLTSGFGGFGTVGVWFMVCIVLCVWDFTSLRQYPVLKAVNCDHVMV